MSINPKPRGWREASPDARAGDLASALLAIRDSDELARTATAWFSRRFGLSGCRLVWLGSAAPDADVTLNCQPGPELSDAEREAVLERLPATAHGPYPIAIGERLSMAQLELTDSAAFAALVWRSRIDGPGSDPDWADAIEVLGKGVDRAMENDDLAHSVRRLEGAERLQRALYAITDLASSDQDMPEMLRGLHQIVARLMYARNFMIALWSAERETLRFVYFIDEVDQDTPPPEREYHASEIANSLTLAMIRNGSALMGPSAELRDAHLVPHDPSLGPDCADWLGVPMLSGGTVRGAVVVQSYDARVRFSGDDRTLLAFVAQHILTALERKQAHEALEARVEERTRELAHANAELVHEIGERMRAEHLQSRLYGIAELSHVAASLEDFYARVHRAVGELIDARNFYIALLSDDGAWIEFPYSVDAFDIERARRRLSGGLTEYVLRIGRPLLVDRAEHERLRRAGELQMFGSPAVSWLGAPIAVDGRNVGVVAVQSYDGSVQYSTRDLELLTYIGHHLGTALQRKRNQDSLRIANLTLERRVAERTRELAEINRALREQIGERERVESRLVHQALHDALTGLPNRTLFLDRLSRALARRQRDTNHRFAVLFLDLDRFKVVNDSVGHLVGDEMLKEAGARIGTCVRAPDSVARLGGDEFAILLEEIAETADAFAVARRVIDALSEPIRVEGKELFTSASVGIALDHSRYHRAEELLRDADVAMYRAKANGRHRFELFDEALHTEALRVLDLEGDLRRAISRAEFEPYFQPIVRLADASVVGYEALLRWRHGERGLLSPGDFLGVAEESGAVEQIDWQMFDLTCRQIPALAEKGAYVCINVSARHFRNADLDETLLNLLRVRGIAPTRIRLEVTEGALLDNPDRICRILERLRAAGVVAQLDDFGTGYSSLSYLHQFPIHSLKIDRSFVADLEPGSGGGSTAVVRAITALAQSLGLEVVAEGIETDAQRMALIELGCTLGQGFLFSRPQPPAAFVVAGAPQ
jgi:diguanylate cyclase (GGDEF)-like protein